METEAEAKPKSNVSHLPVVQSPRMMAPSIDIFSDPEKFAHAQRVANVFASSSLVPPHMQNVANVLIALDIANRLGEQALTVMQNIYVVSGRPGWKTEYVIARANRAGVFSSRITWKVTGAGDNLSVTANATLAGTGEAVDATCDMKMAMAEQWTRNAKYKSMPEHMLKWRSAAFLIRLYAPEVMLGLPTLEEAETMPDAMRDVTPPTQSMKDALDSFAGSKPAAGNELDEFNDTATTKDTKGDAEVEETKRALAEAEAKEVSDRAAAAAEAERAELKAAAAEAKEAKAVAAAKAKQAEGELDDKPAAEKTKGATTPKNAPEYLSMLKAHVDAATDDAALKAWFLSEEQKKLRGKCGVIGADLDTAKNYTLAKIGALTSKTGG